MDNFNIQKFFKDQYLTEDYTSEYDPATAKRNAFAASYNRPGDTKRFRDYMGFLSKLRVSGKTNMFGAAPYLQAEFNLEKKEARDLLAYWMGSYRNPDSDESLNENFEMGDRVKLTPDYEETPGEVFTITQTSGNKYFIADEDGRGWYTYGDQLVMADDELDEVELTQDFGELDEDHTKAENKKLKKIKKELDGASKMHKKQASIIKKIVKEIREFQQPKSFDPDTIRLVREMLEAADIHYNELVEGDGEVSSFLDKRSGGTYFKFPHFNGGPGMFGKATVDRIERSKAAAKQAALKTYTQFKEYIEDYEIGDASPTGVYGSVYLFVMFNDSAEDYSAPKGGTQSSQFEEIDEQAPPPPAKGEAPAKGGTPAPMDADAKAEKKELDDLEKEKFNVRIKYLNRRKAKASAQAAKQSSTSMKSIQTQIDQLIQQRSKVGMTPPASPQKENKIMKTNKLLSNYLKENESNNLKTNLNEHQKVAKRQMLMEGALKQFFEMFDMGKTDEEIVLDYATKGVSVPEQFVKKARSQYETLSKLKTELEMSEKEFKNSASNIVNNPVTGEADMLDDDKQLASAITSEEI